MLTKHSRRSCRIFFGVAISELSTTMLAMSTIQRISWFPSHPRQFFVHGSLRRLQRSQDLDVSQWLWSRVEEEFQLPPKAPQELNSYSLAAHVDRVCKGKPTLHVGNGWVGPYNPGPMRRVNFFTEMFGSDALKIKPPNNEPLVLTLGFQKTNHTERNHTEGRLLVHLLITHCKETCPPFILLAKEQPHEEFGMSFSLHSTIHPSILPSKRPGKMLALCPATKITTTIALKRIGCLSK